MMHSFFQKRWITAIISLLAIASSCSRNELTGEIYQGYYHPVERITLEFENESKVQGEISSCDFVGNFQDYIYGHYEYNHPYIDIVWTDIDPNNSKYVSSIPNLDSIIINESLDTLRIYEGNKEYILPKYSLFDIDNNAPINEQIGEYVYQSIILFICFFFKHFFSIVITSIVLYFATKWWKKRRQQKTK